MYDASYALLHHDAAWLALLFSIQGAEGSLQLKGNITLSCPVDQVLCWRAEGPAI